MIIRNLELISRKLEIGSKKSEDMKLEASGSGLCSN